MAREASERLLDALFAQALKPEFCFPHRWRAGDLLLRDNRATMLRRDRFDANARRIVYRSQIDGSTAPRKAA